MKRLVLLLLLCLASISGFAQKKAPSAKKPAAKATSPDATEETLRKAYRAGEYAKAVQIADQLLAKKPGDQRTLVIKAMSYGMLGKKEMVRKTADVLYPHSPDTEANFLAVLPINLTREVLKRDGAWYIAEAHKISPSSPVVYMIESSLYVDDSVYDKGITAARAGIALVTDKTALPVQGQLANLLHMGGAKEEAYKNINKLLASNPSDSATQITNYVMLLRDKKHQEALTSISKLIAQYSSEKRLIKERAFLYEDMNRHSDACKDALQLAETDDTYFALLRKLGCPQAFANLNPTQVKTYTYDVDYNGMKYQFIVEPSNIKMDNGARFNWKMTMRDDMKGTIAISKAALDTAHGQMNKFSAGNSDLNNLTSVWVSNAVYRELKKDGKSTITAGESGAKTFMIVPEEDETELTITNAAGRTRALKVLHIRSDDEQEELWINDDANNPLITRMNLGWTIQLSSID